MRQRTNPHADQTEIDLQKYSDKILLNLVFLNFFIIVGNIWSQMQSFRIYGKLIRYTCILFIA